MIRFFLNIRNSFHVFWTKNPALFLALFILLGSASAFLFHPLLIFISIFLSLTAKSKPTFLLALLCFFSALFLTAYRYPKVVLPNEKIPGIGVLHIEEVKTCSSMFNRSMLYQGTLKRFEATNGQIFENLPCFVHLPLFGKHPPANTDYAITGTLSQRAEFVFVLKPTKNQAWTPLPSFPNLSHLRFCAKQALSKHLKQNIADPKARVLLTALATAQIDERILTMEFAKVGLQHILAISGFHFALFALFLNALFRLLFSYKTSAILLIASLSFYAFFLGNTPSIQRAYIAICLFAIAPLFSLKISGLNALGSALAIELLLNPLVVTKLSFQLTFLATLAILLFYPLCDHLLSFFLKKRSYSELKQMSSLDQHGYPLITALRQTLALNFAVHLLSIPVLLHLFHKFPLLSIAYNLFFPPCIVISMLLLFLALFFAPWIPPLSHLFHTLNNTWTSHLLQITTNPPAFLDFSIRTQMFSFSHVILFLSLCFFLGVIFYNKVEKKSL